MTSPAFFASQELLYATVSSVRLELETDNQLARASLSARLLQFDNLLPTCRHPLALRIPSSAFPEGESFQLSLVRQASGRLGKLSIKVSPAEVALEAGLLLRVGRLLGTARRSAGVSRAALSSHLSPELREPPDWSSRQLLFCDELRVSRIAVSVSSWLDFQLEQMNETASRHVGLHAGGADWLTVMQQLPVVGSLLKAMVVLVKGLGINLANASGVPFDFKELHIEYLTTTASELAHMSVALLEPQPALAPAPAPAPHPHPHPTHTPSPKPSLYTKS